MCDTRTWVFKLLIVFITIHFSRIQQCHGVNAAIAAVAGVRAGGSSTGMDVIARGPAIDTADVSIDDDDDDDDAFERTSSPEDTLSESQRTNFNSTFNSNSNFRQNRNKDEDDDGNGTGDDDDDDETLAAQSSLSSDRSSAANRLPSDEEATDVDRNRDDGNSNVDDADVDDEDDGSNEGFIANQRKFNNQGTSSAGAAAGQARVPAVPPQQKQSSEESSKRSSILNILQGVDYIGAPSTPQPTSIAPHPQSWDGNTNTAAVVAIATATNADDDVAAGGGGTIDDDDDDEDVDEILQPMVMASDKHHYHSNNGGRVMNPGVGYPIEYNPNRNEESSGSNNLKETPVTNRIKSGGYVSAFEQHKALIRNSRRYGHKTHKKKYKDYLRYNPPTTPSTKSLPTTTISSLRKGILARDRIFSSDDIPRQYYEGHVNYFANTDEDNNNYGDSDRKDQNSRGYHSIAGPRQHHNSHHLRSGGRYRHIGVSPIKANRPHSSVNTDYNGMNYHHLGSRAMLKHQKELEKKIEEYSQYYAKWPHLAQVEDQLFEDEHTDLLYPDEGGSSPGELVLSADDEDDEKKSARKQEEEEANLPPYIKKYRRRNKQLKDLLEGTKPPSTIAPQWSSSVLKPGPIDGSYQNHHHQHRNHHNHRQHRNHQRQHRHKNSKWQIEDLFEEQRANPNNPNKTTVYSEVAKPTPSVVVDSRSTTTTTPTTTTTSTTTLSPFDELLKHENEHLKLLQENKLPAEDVSISRELYDWAIDTSNDQPLGRQEFNQDIVNDDNDDDLDDDYIDLNQNRQHKWKTSNRNASPVKSPTTTTRRPAPSVRRPSVYGSIIRSPPTSTPRPINSFVYHRVVESPRAVGAGQTGRKQRLPFVAITDRRLETSRKGMGNAGVLAHKDFEQNHFPMP
ncbi:uncharacterized protein LOC129944657 [Eupeodes corollae]|uniref:uncharacterized protein LOC129944657 n=1 Tax=Eupeodes corollae TaxID=290404 RepID=UPI0024927857|nr:uncharacterized protein LOC129944657 [Eupeodes corollae]XP_055910219.1 uncharacterized protein LOC129944657 [Eupeodes corollae]XP_055910220.1 uncharacterized protein LOC129944657 [Eupeodes corollae]XP_055910221.1 uncharacterized protein LOC129944657 [Eupeodes corollae]